MFFRSFVAAMVFVHVFAAQSRAFNSPDEVLKVQEAIEVIQEIFAIPEKSIPPFLLAKAHAVVVLPKLVKAGFIIGGRHGTGVMMVRDHSGSWHYPVMVSLSGGSIGWQIGAQSSDIILVFKHLQSVEAIRRGKFTIGGNASIAAGPVGRHVEAATDVMLESEIYSYSRSRGLFAGIALEGGILQIDHDATWALYSRSAYDLLSRTEFSKLPEAAVAFHKMIAAYPGGKN